MKNLSTLLTILFFVTSTAYSQVHVDSDGNAGIGTSTPQGILHIEEPGAFLGITFAGSGLNDLTVNNGAYSGIGSTAYAIRINNAGPTPNLIETSSDGGSTWSSPTPINNPISLANGVTATFASTGGHTFSDQWDWTVNESFSNSLIVKNGRTGIGTATPTQKLDVDGTTRIRSLSGTGARPVYVDSDGKLISTYLELNSQGSSPGTVVSGSNCTTGGIIDVIAVSGFPSSVSSADICVNVNISHAWVDDLEIFIVAPTGDTLLLLADNGGSGDDVMTTFCDNGQSISSGVPPYLGTFKPEGTPTQTLVCNITGDVTSFSALGGGTINPNGNWTLIVNDDVASSIDGTLNSWSVVLSNGGAAAGINNYLPKWSAGTLTSSSSIYDDGNVGIGTFSPSSKLDIVGDIEISGSRLHVSTNGNIGIGTSSPVQKLHVAGSTYITGNVGIGTSSPSSKLDIVGDIEISGSRLHVNTNGRIGIGTSSPSYGLDYVGNSSSDIAEFYNTSTSTTADVLRTKVNQSTPGTGQYFLRCVDGNGNSDGGVRGNGSGGVLFTTTSDRRLKTNIEDFSGALEIIDKVQARQYEFKVLPGVQQYGFIAQELQKIYPLAVAGSPDSDVNVEPMMIDYSLLTPLLAAAIKEQQEEIEELEKTVAELNKSKVTADDLLERDLKIEKLQNSLNALIDQLEILSLDKK